MSIETSLLEIWQPYKTNKQVLFRTFVCTITRGAKSGVSLDVLIICVVMRYFVNFLVLVLVLVFQG